MSLNPIFTTQAESADTQDSALLSDIIETQNDLGAIELDLKTIMRIVAERVQRLAHADGAAVELIEDKQLVCHSGSGIMQPYVGRRLSLNASLAGRAAASGEFQYCDDIDADERADRGLAREIGLRSLIAVPLLNGAQSIGVIVVVSRRTAAFGERLISAVRLMAGLIAASLRHASEFEIKKELLAERTEALAALRESDQRFHNSFEHASIGMALVGLDGRWLQVNQATCRIVGYTENELLTTDFQSITFPDDLDVDLAFVRRLIAGDIIDYQMVKRYIHRQGHLVWVLLSVSLVRNDNGRPLYFIAQIQDITQRQHAEEKLRDQAELLDLAHDSIMVRGLDGTILFWNHGAEEMYGYTKQEAAGRSSHELLRTVFSQPLVEIEAHLLQEGRWEGELNHVDKNGKPLVVTSRWVLQRDAKGRPWRTMEMNSDITKRKQAEDALRASEEEFRATFEMAGVGKVQADLTSGRFTRVNKKFCEITGYSAQELCSTSFAAITHPDDIEQSREVARLMLGGEIHDHSTEKRYIRKDGRIVWVSINATALMNANGSASRAVATILDITERKHAEWLEHDRRAVLELVARDMPLPEVLAQLAEAVERQVDNCRAAVMVLQEGNVLLHGRNLPRDWRAQLSAQSLPLAAALSQGVWSNDSVCGVTHIPTDGMWESLRPTAADAGLTTCWAVPIQTVEGTPLGLLMVFCPQYRHPTQAEKQTLVMAGQLATICIEHHQTSGKLFHLVRHDSLTGLPNRLMFEDRMQQALALAGRSGKSVGLMVLDIDKFKSINDTMGHHAGDHLLQQFAQRLRSRLRDTDTMARVGGDEFVIILPELESADGASAVAQKLLDALEEPFVSGERSLRATTSIGIALYPGDAGDAVTLQAKADAALYRVKERGRNGFSY